MSSYRRRDNAPSGYSSADAYRSVPNTSPSLQHARAVNNNGAASSSEEDHLTSPVTSPQPTPVAGAFVRTRAGSRSRARRESQERGGEPLSPPRPGFLDGDRRSWSASSGASEGEPTSDSDASAAGLAGVGAGASQPARPPAGTNAGRVPVRSHDRVRSNSSQQAGRPSPVVAAQSRARNHRRRSSMANEYAYSGSAGEEEPQSPSSQTSSYAHGMSNPFGSPNDTPRNSFYGAQGAPVVPDKNPRLPPSAFPSFPFQSHAGNPDPGTSIPGLGRRESIDSLAARSQNGQILHTPNNINQHPLSPTGGTAYPASAAPGGYGLVEDGAEDLGRPFAPFMGDATDRSQTPPSPGSNGQLYRSSAAAVAAGKGEYGSDSGHGLPRTGSTAQISMRAPFLSPASRPTSSLWAPPSFPYAYPPGSGSSTALNGYAGSGIYNGQYSSYADIQAQLRKSKPILPSSRITQKLTKEDKPWLTHKDGRARASYWLTVAGIFAGIAGAAILCYFTWVDTYFLADSQICTYFYDDFSGGLDTNTWVPDNELGGFGNGEFQITRSTDTNLHVTNGQLYITPTLVSDEIDGGYPAILDGGSFSLGDDCSTNNATACSATSSNSSGAVINPVFSSRISTNGTKSMTYGKVEVVAKLPQGDWLWPAIWMLPTTDSYGEWPLSGEIDIMEARGNAASYPGQGVNYVRASLNYGPLAALYTTLFGWWSEKQSTFADAFHTYTLEWTEDFMRLYVDTRLDAMLTLKIQGKGGKSFFDRGNYPSTTQNGSSQAVVENIWSQKGGGANAPFDQEFYLLLDLAVGGTSGWFPDGVGGKPWYDGSDSAMREFAEAQGTWYSTWPSNVDDRSFRIQSVKMSKLAGQC